MTEWFAVSLCWGTVRLYMIVAVATVAMVPKIAVLEVEVFAYEY